ncbi:SF0329 family protein [Peribacillus butanolivorans]
MLYSPKWSKAKKRLSDLLCETLHSRVDFQVINYRKAHDQLGRAVITVDKVEILSMCTITAAREEFLRCDAENIKMNQFISSGIAVKNSHKTLSHKAHKK